MGATLGVHAVPCSINKKSHSRQLRLVTSIVSPRVNFTIGLQEAP